MPTPAITTLTAIPQYNRSNWDFKVNYNPTDKAMVWGRYSISPMDIVALLVLGPAGGDAFGGGNPGHAGGRVQTTAAGFTYAVSPTMLVDGNVGYTRQNIGANGDPQDGFYGLDVLKIPGTNGVGPNYCRHSRVPGYGRRQHRQHQHGQPVPVPRQPVHHRHSI